MTYPPQQPEGWSDPAYPAHPPAGQPPVSGPAGPGYPPIPDPAGAYPPPMAYPVGKDAAYPYATGYPTPGYEYGAWGAPRKTNGTAIASLVVSIIGAFGLACYGAGGLLAAVGAILGHVARRQIRTNGDDGDGLALAGIITGWIATALGVAIIAFIVIVIVFAVNNSSTTDTGVGGPYY
ncbi:DUF4190 domain-containing protein [Catenuloplanes atrovinosus]|uniref:DUF4190 domain-containing protein n=1 Tax=Catenuloplanes atrovinosus TaxID=137266 RepID=A0AAE4CF16_9ACTN|nr:DUF4190 domain-containing protein [Catenuloplanes atrovinosus]MDR7280589.1 hypothetical protein [Catenuloplanes atrovinosus]